MLTLFFPLHGEPVITTPQAALVSGSNLSTGFSQDWEDPHSLSPPESKGPQCEAFIPWTEFQPLGPDP